jgi:hypothetical protein
MQKVFYVGLIASVALFGYLIYGLFTGQMANAAGKSELQHATELVTQLSFYLNISLVITVIAASVLFYEAEAAGLVLLLIAAFMAYGLRFSIDFLFASDAARLTTGTLSKLTLNEIQSAAFIVGVPGILLFVRSLFVRIMEGRRGPDLANMQFGNKAQREEVPRALIGAAAKCWQLPFCREAIRVKCPIYLSRTKCWKERVGCMCEENIILLATGGEEHKPIDMTKSVGFVAIGDMIAKSEAEKRPNLPTRQGPRGVRIPTNPHLSYTQKRDRCRNCVIYNEHQRQKYQFFSPIVTIMVPALVLWQFDWLRDWLGGALHSLDALIGSLKFTGESGGAMPVVTKELTNSLFIEGFIILCLTMVIMTWALRFLEYCTFKIKI